MKDKSNAKPDKQHRWLSMEMVLAFHDEQLSFFGGGEGIRDQGLLESALAKAVNRYHYEPETSIFKLAAAYGIGVIKNHPFIDGNKRTGLISMHVFLALNGWGFSPDPVEAVQIILELASGDIQEDDLVRWLEESSCSA